MINDVIGAVSALLGALMSYFAVYYAVGLLFKAKEYPETAKKRRFGIIIAARNEEKVIGALLESIAAQSYPRELISVFCVADNCVDSTACIARIKGATVYERNDAAKARKGYALEFLFENIERDYGISSFDAFVFFDADNVLEKDYLAEMDRALEGDASVVTGYRMASNFGDSFVSAAYGIHFLRSSAFSHRPRSLLGISTHVAGTGFAVKSSVLREGWHFHSLTEDTEFTLWAVSRGMTVGYCEKARFYDEQPVTLKIALRQRIRWQKGRLVCFLRYAPALLRGIFTGKGKNVLSCYDMFFYIFPKALFNFVLASVAFFAAFPSFDLKKSLCSVAAACVSFAAIGAVTVIRERKNVPVSGLRSLLYLLAFPWFDLVALPLSLISLLIPVKWKPIPHTGGKDKKSVFTCKMR